jgi:calcineurin-like phosphoesterase family protein
MAFTGTQWFTADLHLEHPGIVKERDGVRNRPFETCEEHDEAVIERWNGRVKPKDKVYVIGDVSIKKIGLQKLARLNGLKPLIKGNHDIFELHDYTPYFYQINGCRVFHGEDTMIATHMPIHPMEMKRFEFNVHGHLHDKQVMRYSEVFGREVLDLRYLCVSLEQTGFAPVSLDEILAIRKDRGL